MPEERGSLRACTVQGKVNGGRVELITELENNYGEKVWTFREGKKRARAGHGRGEDGPWGKDTEIKNLKDGLCQAKEVAVREYCDSDALLSELGDSFLQGFEDVLRQVKKAYLDLDVSNIKMEDQAQTSVLLVASDDTNDLFAEADGQGEGESALVRPIINTANQPVPESTTLAIIKVTIQPVAEQQENASTQL